MTIDVKNNEDALTLVLEGRLDTTTAPMLEKTVNEQMEGKKEIILDMNELEYISSAGLRVLLSIQKKMNKIGTFKLTGVCDDVMEVFEMTGFNDILTIE